MGRYFLSYARADGPFALRLAGDLRAAGVELWLDQLDILPSQRWDRDRHPPAAERNFTRREDEAIKSAARTKGSNR
jgi:hypothetical protein